jgi:hypothetical protein
VNGVRSSDGGTEYQESAFSCPDACHVCKVRFHQIHIYVICPCVDSEKERMSIIIMIT